MDRTFYNNLGPILLDALAEKIGGTLIAPSDQPVDIPTISGIRHLEEAGAGDLTFLANTKYEDMISSTKASAAIVEPDFLEKRSFKNLWLITHPNPYYAYSLAMDLLYVPKAKFDSGIEDSARIDKNASLGEDVYVGHNVVIEAGAQVGGGSVIGSNSYIGHNVRIGKNARIDPNVTITHSIIGDSFVALPGARIGQDGFGFSTHQGKHKKIFHIGRVIIEDDVEIGANTTIDRGALKDTIIKKGARLDNLVQVAHNVEIGEGSILVSQVGVAGSTKVGKYCAFGGQAGFAGHLKIADGSRVAGQAGVQHDIDEPGGTYFGTPALPIRDWQRQNVAIKRLVKKEEKKK